MSQARAVQHSAVTMIAPKHASKWTCWALAWDADKTSSYQSLSTLVLLYFPYHEINSLRRYSCPTNPLTQIQPNPSHKLNSLPRARYVELCQHSAERLLANFCERPQRAVRQLLHGNHPIVAVDLPSYVFVSRGLPSAILDVFPGY